MKHAVIIALFGSSMGLQLSENSSTVVLEQTGVSMQLVAYDNLQSYSVSTDKKSLSKPEVIVENNLHQYNQILKIMSIVSNNQNHNEEVVVDQIVKKKKFLRTQQLDDKYKLKNLQRKCRKPCIPSHR